MSRILLLGATGLIGRELAQTLATIGTVLPLGRKQVDLANPQSVANNLSTVMRTAPHLIVNAAEFAAVEQAEVDTGTAMMVNATAPGLLAEEARRLGIPLLHFSTAYVFDGSKNTPYQESDDPSPLNVYGHSKLVGEGAIIASGCQHLIFRTSWVYGLSGESTLCTMQHLGSEREVRDGEDEQVGAPTWTRSIARATTEVLAQCRRGESFNGLGRRGGLYHLSAGGHTSWQGFAKEVFALDPKQGLSAQSKLHPPPKEGDRPPAQHLRNSRLDCAKLEQAFGVRLPPWQVSLREAMVRGKEESEAK